MCDTRLRELERRWKETGSPDDEAAYLLERVRVGDLTQERLELAAYCGHRAAMTALGEREPALCAEQRAFYEEQRVDPAEVSPFEHLEAWLLPLERFGLRFAVACGLAAARLVVDLDEGADDDLGSLVNTTHEAVAQWLRSPSSALAAVCGESRERLLERVELIAHETGEPTHRLEAAYRVAGGVCDNHPYGALMSVMEAAYALSASGSGEEAASSLARSAAAGCAITLALSARTTALP